MKYAYYIEQYLNTAIITEINAQKVDLDNTYIEEQANSNDELIAVIKALKQDDTLILKDVKELNPNNPRLFKATLKALQELNINIVALNQPKLSGLGYYDSFKEILAINRHYKKVLKQ
jgi:hypothetical protein